MALRSVSVAALLVVLAAGCSPSKQALSTTTTSTTVAAPVTTSTGLASDKAKAQRLVLVASDLPGEWDVTPADEESAQNLATDNSINSCIGLPPDDQEYDAKVNGESFDQDDTTVDSMVAVTKTAQLAQQDLVGSSDPKNFPCIEKILSAAVASVVGPGTVATAKISTVPGVRLKNNQLARRITTDATRNGLHAIEYDDLLVADDGRFQITMTVSTAELPPPADLDQQLLNAAQSHIVALNTSA